MKKHITVLCAALLVLSLCSCGKKAEDSPSDSAYTPAATSPTFPTESSSPSANVPSTSQPVTTPTAPATEPATEPATDKTEPTQSTSPSGSTTEEPGDPPLTNITDDDKTETVSTTVKLGSRINNTDYSAKGDKFDKSVSGSAATYTVRYSKYITFKVTVTEESSGVKIDGYLDHYSMYVGEKDCTVTVGGTKYAVRCGKIEWKDNKAAESHLFSFKTDAVTPGEKLSIAVNIPYLGSYNGEYIDNFSVTDTDVFG